VETPSIRGIPSETPRVRLFPRQVRTGKIVLLLLLFFFSTVTAPETSSRRTIPSESSRVPASRSGNLQNELGRSRPVSPPRHTTRLPSNATITSVAADISHEYRNLEERMQKLKDFLERFGDRCPVCWFFGEINSHNYFSCSKFAAYHEDYNIFRKKLSLPPYRVCYFCLAPQAPPFNHPLPRKGQTPDGSLCTFPDILKPLIFLISAHKRSSDAVFDRFRFSDNDRNVDGFCSFLSQVVPESSMINLHEVVLFYYESN
jgi:hypothetical protein